MKREYVIDLHRAAPRTLHYRMHGPVRFAHALTRCGSQVKSYALVSGDRATLERIAGPLLDCQSCVTKGMVL